MLHQAFKLLPSCGRSQLLSSKAALISCSLETVALTDIPHVCLLLAMIGAEKAKKVVCASALWITPWYFTVN